MTDDLTRSVSLGKILVRTLGLHKVYNMYLHLDVYCGNSMPYDFTLPAQTLSTYGEEGSVYSKATCVMGARPPLPTHPPASVSLADAYDYIIMVKESLGSDVPALRRFVHALTKYINAVIKPEEVVARISLLFRGRLDHRRLIMGLNRFLWTARGAGAVVEGDDPSRRSLSATMYGGAWPDGVLSDDGDYSG